MDRVNVLKVDGLCKRYAKGAPLAANGITFNCYSGEIVGIIGKNGAGKSTTIKSIVGILPFESGTVEICGHNIVSDGIAAKQCFGYVSDNHAVFEKMTGIDYVTFMANVYGVERGLIAERVAEMDGHFKLGSNLQNLISSYSHGMKQKISIMGELVHQPRVLILDEPLTGLDVQTASSVKKLILDYKEQGNTVLFSSHSLDVVEKICDRAIIISKGVLLEDIDLAEYRQTKTLELEDYFLSLTAAHEEAE